MRLFLILYAALAVAFVGCKEEVAAPPADLHTQLSGANALEQVALHVGIGSRTPGSEGLAKSRALLIDALTKNGWASQEQSFKNRTPNGVVTFVNLRARFLGGRSVEEVWAEPVKGLLGSHYDTKIYKNFEFVGANDAGSSTGLLVEISRVLSAAPSLARDLELVFFDGEEAFVRYTRTDGLYGSRHYAQEIIKKPIELRPKFLVLLDMVGDKDLNVRVPVNSSRRLTDLLLQSADELGKRSYFGAGGNAILDDHVPLDNVGVEVIDIIDLDYSPWHTKGDTMDKVSAESLETVGQVTVHLLQKLLTE